MTNATVFAQITKVDKNPDGTLFVRGKVTGTNLDSDKQRMSAAFLAKAMPRWMETGGNVREAHGATVAGVGVELTRGGNDDWQLKAHVLDPVTVLKVERKALTGFSIGIANARILKGRADAPNGEIVDGEVYEVSLVDRPSLGDARITICKSVGGTLTRVDPDDEDDDTPDAVDQLDDDDTEEDEDEPMMTSKAYAAAAQLAEDALDGRLAVRILKGSGVRAEADVEQTVEQLAQLLATEGRLLAEAAAGGELHKGYNLGGAVRALEALRTLTDPDADQIVIRTDGVETVALVEKAFTGWVAETSGQNDEDGDSLDVTTESLIQKSAREAQFSDLQAQLETVQAELAKVQATERPGGPILTKAFTQATTPAVNPAITAEVDRIDAALLNPALDREVRSALVARRSALGSAPA
jgi:hypothetical protein